ncbi:MAG: tRNA lysidine(34) synthetase TilS [Candidatus Aminicenantes bacterium]|jgi:tRNA(Ile)-lysidine synthase
MLLDKVKETVRRYSLFSPKERILIASSGGPDSTALLYLLGEIQEEWSLTLALAHFNHKLRRSAEDDEFFVRQTADSLSLPVFVGHEDVRAFSAANRLNLEEAGRQLRYGFLKETAQREGYTKIAVGHTMNDQAETFFMRLIRGSGLPGLSGIFPVLDGQIVRPLIQTQRPEIEAYLKKIKAEYRVDESNFDRRFLRNRIRNELLPFFQKEFDPHIISRIGKVTSVLQEDEKVLRELADKEARKAIVQQGGEIFLDCRSLSNLPVGIARRLVRAYIAAVKGDLRKISFEDIESVLGLEAGKETHLKGDLLLRREGNAIFRKKAKKKRLSFEISWTAERPLVIAELNKRIFGRQTSRAPEGLAFDDRKEANLDLETLHFPLTVRLRREGDRYQPLGSPGRKKLKEVMRAKNIPVGERDRMPVFLSAGEIVWVYGLPVSEKFKITPKTKEAFVISVESGTAGRDS